MPSPTIADTPGGAPPPPPRLLVVGADSARACPVAEAIAAKLGGSWASCLAVRSAPEALEALRREAFDGVVALHEPPLLDALVLARALRGAGDETPLAILGAPLALDLEAAAWAAGADEYACLAEATAAQVAGRLRRAIDTRTNVRQLRRLLSGDRQRLASEQEEAELLAASQQRLLAELRELPVESMAGGSPRAVEPRVASPRPAATGYGALVERVLSGDPPSADEVHRLAEQMVDHGLAAPDLLEAHLAAVGVATTGLSPRAVRRVVAGADRLLLEAAVHLAESYRRRYVAGETSPSAVRRAA